MRAALTLLAVLAACDSLEPRVGPAALARCLDDDSDPDTQVSYQADIQPIFSERCKTCHTPGGAAPIGLQFTGLDLSSHQTVLAGAIAGPVVVPGQPCASVLLGKVSPGPPFGSRMPLNGPPFLSDRQLQLIHDWIAEGALDN
jgi:mono/diheme cytochrome c family protein